MGKKRKTSVRCKTSKNQNKHKKEYQIQKQKRKNVCGDKDVISEYRVPLNQIFDKNGLSSDSIYDELLNKSSDNSSVYSGNTSIMSAINLQKKEIARSILFGNKSKDGNKSSSAVSPYLKGHNKMEQFKSKLKQIEMRKEKEKQNNNNNNNKSNNSKSRFMLAKIRSNSLKSNIMSDEETIIMKRNSRSNSNVSGDTLMTSQTRSTIENNNNSADSANINKSNINEKKKRKRKRGKNQKNENIVNDENLNENENIIVINNLDDQVTSKILLKIVKKLILSRKETTNDANSILLNQDCLSLDMIHIGYKNGLKYARIDFMTHDLHQNDTTAQPKANFIKQLLTGKKLFGKLLCVSTAAIEDVTDIDEEC